VINYLDINFVMLILFCFFSCMWHWWMGTSATTASTHGNT